jgi:flap endonuclease-1
MGIKGLLKFLKTYASDSIKTTTPNDYVGKTIAIDTSIIIYQYVIALKGAGANLTDSNGNSTSHIYGILNKAINILSSGVKPIFVFDGVPPNLKQDVLDNRKKMRNNAKEKISAESDEDEKKRLSKRTVSISRKQMEQCKEILKLIGLPVVEAPEEADAQCAYLVKNNLAYAVGSEDMDILPFGSCKLLRNFTSYKNDEINEIDLQTILSSLDVNHEQFIDICILLGCDYTCTVTGLGPKSILGVIKNHGSIDNFILDNQKVKKNIYKISDNFCYKPAREYFQNAPVLELTNTDIVWKKPSIKRLQQILVDRYNFKSSNVSKIISRLKKNHPCLNGKITEKKGFDLTTFMTSTSNNS